MAAASITHWRPVAALLPVFLVTRLAIFFAVTSSTDYQVYYVYAQAARGDSVAALYREHDIEYPQLAVVFGIGVSWVAEMLPSGAERLIAARANPPISVGAARYQVAIGLVLFAIDATLFLLIARVARQMEPNDSRIQTWRVGLYVAGTALLGPLIYDRLDLVVGASALFGLIALACGRSILAYAVLTVGVGLKLVPLLLLPVIVVGAATQREGRFWRAIVREAAVALLVLALWPLLAVQFGGGERAFEYTKYHALRGPELGSVYAAPLLLRGDTDVGFAFGSYEVRGTAADAVAKVSPLVALFALMLAGLVVARAIHRASQVDRMSVIASGCVLVWLAFILTNKVGSPQYMLWLTPIVPLMPLNSAGARRWGVYFCLASLLATLMYPYLWETIIGERIQTRPNTWTGPTPVGFAVLFARWAIVIVLTVWLGMRLWRLAPQSATLNPVAAPTGV